MKYLGIAALLFLGCSEQQEFREELANGQTHKQYHTRLSSKLERAQKLNIQEFLGRTPSSSELELGRLLFSDTILSRNNDVSCATCHLTNHGFADGNSLTVGAGGRGGPNGDNVGESFARGKLSLDRHSGDFGFGHQSHHHMFRNALSTLNVGYRINSAKNQGLFWDGRFGELHFQVLLPLHTAEEMCGTNPLVLTAEGENIFREGGPLFNEPVRLTHVNSVDQYSGQNTGYFNAQPTLVKGIPYKRKNNQISIPNRNECLALVIAKLRLNNDYKSRFNKAYPGQGITDKTLAMALQSFLLTHVAINAPVDRFLRGEESMSERELKGLELFVGKAGCFNCHNGPLFGGQGYANIGVKSDIRSSLSRSKVFGNIDSGFFERPQGQRGLSPDCHIEGVSASANGYTPDMGYASVSLKKEDCFSFRIPSLRNVIETYPYFHHGSEKLEGEGEDDFTLKSFKALKRVVRYHIRGPINALLLTRRTPLDPYVDPLRQLDPWIPFLSLDKRFQKRELSEEEIEDLTHFIAFGLWDQDAVKEGLLGNPLSHPKKVPSKLHPTITRDHGTQLDYP